MWLALLAGLAFLAGAAYNAFGPAPDLPEALAGAGIGGTLIAVFFVVKREHRRAEEFLSWLEGNAAAVAGGGARYGDVLITPATVVTRYQTALSFLIVSFKIPSRFYVRDHDATGVAAAVCTGVSLLLGWWGIPWGPVYTIQALATNFRGGVQRTVGELLNPMSA